MQEFRNRLKEFFVEPRNTARREALLLNKLSYDFQLASAISGYYLKTYISDVDDNGYDVILDSEMVSHKIQVKSFLSSSKTSSWAISKGLIKPDLNQQRTIPAWTNIQPGIGGGIVLQKVFVRSKDIEVEYFYSDIHIITLIAFGIIGDSKKQSLARKFISQLHSGDYHDKITITKSLFVKPASVEHLLSVMDLHSRYSTTNWRYYMRHRHFSREMTGYLASTESLDESIRKEFEELCHS